MKQPDLPTVCLKTHVSTDDSEGQWHAFQQLAPVKDCAPWICEAITEEKDCSRVEKRRSFSKAGWTVCLQTCHQLFACNAVPCQLTEGRQDELTPEEHEG